MDLSRRTVLLLGTGTLLASIATVNVLAAELEPAPVPRLGPVSYPDLSSARQALKAPADASYVMWDHGNQTLEDVFTGLGDNDILVLPERADPYLVDSADGFRAAGVSAVSGANGTLIPVVSRYRNESARTWFAMARARRGILGLGPGAVITTTDSGFSQEPQIPDLDASKGDPGRFYYDLAGTRGGELRGAAEKVIETEHEDAYYGNFTMRGRDFGGVAYSAITMKGGIAEHLDLDGAWRGFSGVPNGETAAVSVNGGHYLISRTSTSPLDEGGRRVGSSPVMVNNSPGGRWEYGDSSQALAGMPTIWNSAGRHEWFDVVSRWGGPGVNLERTADGFEFSMVGGALWPNRDGKGGHPSPDGIYSTGVMHVHLHALGEATITLTNVDLDENIQPGKLCVQLYGAETDPQRVKVIATNTGKTVPVAYGESGVVELAP